MRNLMLATIMVLGASSSFAGGTDIGSGSTSPLGAELTRVMTCTGAHVKSGNRLVIQAYASNKQKGKGLVTIGQKGDSNQFPYEATIVVQPDLVSFDLEWVKDGLELGGEVAFNVKSVVSGIKFETNNKTLSETSFTCSND